MFIDEMNAYVIYDTPRNNLNLLYWGHFDTPDAFFALKLSEKIIAFVSELEFSRCQTTSTFDEVCLFSEIRKTFLSQDLKKSFWLAFFEFLQKKYLITQFIVPENFPAAIYAHIYKNIPIAFDKIFFDTQRALKSTSEAKEIRKACALTADTIRYAKTILKESSLKNGLLYYQNGYLTSERLRALMEIYCLEHGGYATDTIVACGNDTSNPHYPGQGMLYENQLIVIDFFPRLQTSHYYGDMTRTVIKGQATPEQAQLYHCVLECQQALIQQLHPGVQTSDLQAFALKFFERNGYELKRTATFCEGFIHSFGHGIGLDLHEYPLVGSKSIALETGMVITIEPGLYFKFIGGVRIEDTVLITPTGYEILSQCDYTLEL